MGPDRFSLRKSVRQSRARDTVDAILDASARIVHRDGIASLTTNRIAEIAGVSIGSLYQYFPGKDAVLHALVQRQFNKVVDGHVRFIDAIDPAVTPVDEAVAAIVNHVFDSQMRERPFLREILLSVLSIRHLRFTLENDTRVLTAVRERFAAYGVRGDELDTGAFVALYALKGIQIGVVFADLPSDDQRVREAATRAILACIGAAAYGKQT